MSIARLSIDCTQKLPVILVTVQERIARRFFKENPRAARIFEQDRPGISDPCASIGKLQRRGKAKRIRLARRSGRATGVLCARRTVIGLHQRDNDRTLQNAERIARQGTQ